MFIGMVLAQLSGCKVVDAPSNLEDLVVFGFETFGSEDEMQVTIDNLVPLLDENSQELNDGFRVGEITTAQLAAVGVENDSSEGIAGAMGLVSYRNTVDDVIGVITDPDKEEYFDNMDRFDPDDTGDRACFLDHTCDTFEQYIEETVNVTLLGESKRKYTNKYQWVENETHGTVLVIQSLSPDPIEFNTNIANVFQQYSIAWLLPQSLGSKRVESFWIDAEVIGSDVPDSFGVNSAVNGMRNTASNIDDVIEGVE